MEALSKDQYATFTVICTFYEMFLKREVNKYYSDC